MRDIMPDLRAISRHASYLAQQLVFDAPLRLNLIHSRKMADTFTPVEASSTV
jgi:hypothetical protein